MANATFLELAQIANNSSLREAVLGAVLGIHVSGNATDSVLDITADSTALKLAADRMRCARYVMPTDADPTQAIQINAGFSHVQDVWATPQAAHPDLTQETMTIATPDFIVVPSDTHIVVNNFDVARGDAITFLGQFSSRADLRAAMCLTGSRDLRDGDVIITMENGARAVFVGVAAQAEDLIDAVFDFSAEGQTAFKLADALNNATSAEIDAFVTALGTDEFDRAFGVGSAAVLLANLDTPAATRLLNVLEAEELDELLHNVGASTLKLLLEELTLTELVNFLSGVNETVVVAMADHMGATTIDALLWGKSPATKGGMRQS